MIVLKEFFFARCSSQSVETFIALSGNYVLCRFQKWLIALNIFVAHAKIANWPLYVCVLHQFVNILIEIHVKIPCYRNVVLYESPKIKQRKRFLTIVVQNCAGSVKLWFRIHIHAVCSMFTQNQRTNTNVQSAMERVRARKWFRCVWNGRYVTMVWDVKNNCVALHLASDEHFALEKCAKKPANKIYER